MRLWLLNPGLILKQVRSGGLLASVEMLSGIHVTCMCASCCVAVPLEIQDDIPDKPDSNPNGL